jgi:hypothetical protein
MKLLSAGITNAKTAKNALLSFILYLAPYRTNDMGINLCPKATEGCIASCLNTSGRGAFSNVQIARLNKSNFWAKQRREFYMRLSSELVKINAKAAKEGQTVLVRLNGTSDIDHLSLLKFYANLDWTTLNNVQFYDYTKVINRVKKYHGTNYKLTFSLSENNMPDAIEALNMGCNVAIVFRKELPKIFLGYPVIDGDLSDMRTADPKGCIVGLRAKGKAKKDTSGFVLN